MHLRNDHALGAVDHECAVFGHERNLAHVNVLLLHVLQRLGLGVWVNFKDHQLKCDTQRCRISHAALLAFLNVKFWLFKFIALEFQNRLALEIRDRKHAFENGLQAFSFAAALWLRHLKELLIRLALHFDEVGHLCHFNALTKKFADTLA